MTASRPGKYRSNAPMSGVGRCPHTGKLSFPTRKAARRRSRRRHTGDRMQAYRCESCGFFHVGHMPDAVRAGVYDKADWKRRMA